VFGGAAASGRGERGLQGAARVVDIDPQRRGGPRAGRIAPPVVGCTVLGNLK